MEENTLLSLNSPYSISGDKDEEKHRNTITIDGSINDHVLIGMIDKSYDLVVSKLTKKKKKHFMG
ncbi:hypothetical protein [Sulfurovum sp.]|jgi:hypothetical protein|uniref:hypothetical protein n=1 Tax=Sulfurovum sp. TaxID=1969726 RepID=UPI002A36C126|nr:hypothetical protein [Sulfurovum sp.]MDD2451034.1 hypothetical protein [Sulfurovum sp.]MDD3499281.1 hypothetical protein [Sulfurovum sp.]MDY0402254.1 hypothetical protein [Sulfurovum sp.]